MLSCASKCDSVKLTDLVTVLFCSLFLVIFLYILPPIQFVDDRSMLGTTFRVVVVIQTADIFCFDNARTSTVLAFYLLQFISVYFCFLLFLPILQCCIWYYTTAKPCELVVCLSPKKIMCKG